jgi:hypothetical protein
VNSGAFVVASFWSASGIQYAWWPGKCLRIIPRTVLDGPDPGTDYAGPT